MKVLFNMRRFAAAILFLAASSFATSALAATAKISFIAINDVYQIAPSPVDNRGGLARVKTMVTELKKKNPGALFTISGDFISPSLMSGVFKGRQMVDMLNVAGLDYASIGNHEFDYGTAVLDERLKEAKFKTLNSNIYRDGALYPGTEQTAIVDINGVKTGIFAILTPRTRSLAAGAANLEIMDAYSTAAEMARELKKKGAKIIVAMTHMDLSEDKKLAETVDGIDIILGGHDHEIASEKVNDTRIIKAGADAKSLALVDIYYDTVSGRKTASTVCFLPVDATVKEDEKAAEIAAGYERLVSAGLDEILGNVTTTLDGSTLANRTSRTNFGSFTASAIRKKMGSDIGIINGGGIRGDRKIGPGAVAKRDILSVFPFGNLVLKIEVDGATLLEALEWGLGAAPEPSGKYPQTDGVEYSFDQSKKSGGRLTAVKVNGAPVEPGRKYTIALTDYMFKGGDGYGMFKNARVVTGEGDAPALLDVIGDEMKNMFPARAPAGER